MRTGTPRRGPSTRTVGSYWTCAASTSRTAAPNAAANTRPSPFRYAGFVENAYFPHQPPVARTIARRGCAARAARRSSTVSVRCSTATCPRHRAWICARITAPTACPIVTQRGTDEPSGRIVRQVPAASRSKAYSSLRANEPRHSVSTSARSFAPCPLASVSSIYRPTESPGRTGQLSAWTRGELPGPFATSVTARPASAAASAARQPASPPPTTRTSVIAGRAPCRCPPPAPRPPRRRRG